jgi:hypothetical protein
MGDWQVVSLQNCVQSPGTTVTTVMLQRVEEVYPAMKECLVSGLDKTVSILCIGVLDLHCQNERGIL